MDYNKGFCLIPKDNISEIIKAMKTSWTDVANVLTLPTQSRAIETEPEKAEKNNKE